MSLPYKKFHTYPTDDIGCAARMKAASSALRCAGPVDFLRQNDGRAPEETQPKNPTEPPEG